jgi:hypothetical protein
MPQSAEKKPTNEATCSHCGRPFRMSHLLSVPPPPPPCGLRYRVAEGLSLYTAEAFQASERAAKFR